MAEDRSLPSGLDVQRQIHADHQKERDVLFSNEAFLIGALQATSGGSVFAAIAQTDKLIAIAGAYAFLSFLTFMAVALLASVLAAYWKHEYKLWHVKHNVSAMSGEELEALTRAQTSGRDLKRMRYAMKGAVLAILTAIVELVGLAWFRLLCL